VALVLLLELNPPTPLAWPTGSGTGVASSTPPLALTVATLADWQESITTVAVCSCARVACASAKLARGHGCRPSRVRR